MPKTFGLIVFIVVLFVGYLLGYSIPPFIHAGVFSDREVKGVEVQIDEDMEKYYEELYQEGIDD
jgi:hypothetical protein